LRNNPILITEKPHPAAPRPTSPQGGFVGNSITIGEVSTGEVVKLALVKLAPDFHLEMRSIGFLVDRQLFL
jgi:hypothetical protein